MTAANPTVSELRMASAMMNLRQLFPELTDNQFFTAAAYTFDGNLHRISRLYDREYRSSKQLLQAVKSRLDVEYTHEIRGVFLMRALGGLYEKK